MTGSRASGPGSGVQTFRLRQLSPGSPAMKFSGISASRGGGYGALAAVGPYATAGRIPCHGSTGRGGPKRAAVA